MGAFCNLSVLEKPETIIYLSISNFKSMSRQAQEFSDVFCAEFKKLIKTKTDHLNKLFTYGINMGKARS